MKLCSIVVTYNAEKWLDRCLSSLLNSSGDFTHHVIVIDNSSSDKTVTTIEKDYSEVELVKLNKNYGFGKANNIGIRKAYQNGADYIFLLNQDAWVNNDTICNLIETLNRSEEFALLSPVHLNGDGTLLDQSFSRYITEGEMGRYLLSSLLSHQNIHLFPVGFVNAAAWMIPRKTLEIIGEFDEVFFHYGEDSQYIFRVKYHGLKIGVLLKSFVYHDRENVLQNQETERVFFLKRKAKILKILTNINLSFWEKTKEVVKYEIKLLGYVIYYLLKLKMIYSIYALRIIISTPFYMKLTRKNNIRNKVGGYKNYPPVQSLMSQ